MNQSNCVAVWGHSYIQDSTVHGLTATEITTLESRFPGSTHVAVVPLLDGTARHPLHISASKCFATTNALTLVNFLCDEFKYHLVSACPSTHSADEGRLVYVLQR